MGGAGEEEDEEEEREEEQMRGTLTGGEGEATCSEEAEGAGELCMAAIGGGDG